MRTIRIRRPNTPCSFSYSLPATSSSETFSNVRTFEKNVMERSMLETVMPTRSTDSMSDGDDGALQRAAGANKRSSPTILISIHPLEKVVAHAQRVRNDR